MLKFKGDDKENANITHIGNVKVKMTEKSVNIENFDAILENLPMKYITMHDKVQEFSLTYLKEVYGTLRQASDSQIKQYYEKNREKAEKFLYQNSLENFQKFVSQIRQMKSETLTYTENIFDVDSLKETEKGFSFKMKIKYEDEEFLTYRVNMSKGNDNQIEEDQIWFEPIG